MPGGGGNPEDAEKEDDADYHPDKLWYYTIPRIQEPVLTKNSILVNSYWRNAVLTVRCWYDSRVQHRLDRHTSYKPHSKRDDCPCLGYQHFDIHCRLHVVSWSSKCAGHIKICILSEYSKHQEQITLLKTCTATNSQCQGSPRAGLH